MTGLFCKKEIDGEPCGNELQKLMIGALRSAMLSNSYLRLCTKCNAVYLLVPKEIELERLEIPFLEHQGLAQIEETIN